MSPRSRLAGALAALGALAACGGGGHSPPPPVTLSGTITAAAATLPDGDTGDPRAPRVPNDSPGAAQLLPSAVTVGGWVSSTADPDDWYRAALAAGQTVMLTIADPVVAGVPELDLFLFDASDPSTPLCARVDPLAAVKTCAVAAAAEVLVHVSAVNGESNYVLTLGQAPGAAGAGTLRLDTEFVPGEVIVRFRDGPRRPAAAETLASRAASAGLEPLAGGPGREMLLGLGGEGSAARAFAALGIERTPLDALAAAADPVRAAKLDTIRVLEALRRRADVAAADPNYVFHPSRVPSDTYFSYQWHYPLVKLPQAWDVTTGAPQAGAEPVIVAVVDTGVVLSHPDFTNLDLSSQLVDGYDFISDAARARDGDGIDPNPDDPGDSATRGQSSFHGTHVAGTVAAASDNGKGVAGVSWGAKIMPIRVLGDGGGTSFDILQGLRWAAKLPNDAPQDQQAARRADVVNLSLGCLECFSAISQEVYDQVRAAGVVVVAAAGNENTSRLSYPASYGGVLSVSAVDLNLARAPYSNFGPTVDVAAPGGNLLADLDANGFGDGVLSTLADDAAGTQKPVYAFLQGTSMASPHVAGVVALMKAVCPALLPGDVDALLASGLLTTRVGTEVRSDVYGYGVIDALAAVQNCGAPIATRLQVSPGRLDFGASASTLSLTASKIGSDPLTVLSSTADETWLEVTPGATVDPDGFGPYSVTVTRGALADGVYSATITFETSPPSTVIIPVTLQVGFTGAGDAGHLYILLLTDSLVTVGEVEEDGAGGLYPFGFLNVPPGRYFLAAGTDSDNDGFVCDDGEACGVYPTTGLPTLIEANRNRTDLDFTVGFEALLNGAGAKTGAARGFRRLPASGRAGAGP